MSDHLCLFSSLLMFIDVMMLEKKNCQHIESVSSENNMFGSSCVASKVGKCFVL